jgi:hypothetical protein
MTTWLRCRTASDIELPQPEELNAAESNYRRGYWDGVLSACNHISDGATQHDVRLWLFRELKDWTQRGFVAVVCKGEYPPDCPKKRSFDEATLCTVSKPASYYANYSFVYAIADGHGHVKIGVADNVTKRLKQLQTGNPHRLYLVAYLPLPSRHDADRVEQTAHADTEIERLCGEWFRMSDWCACQVLVDAADACGFECEPIEVEMRVY